MKNPKGPMGNRTHHIPAFNAVPQLTAPRRATTSEDAFQKILKSVSDSNDSISIIEM